jgi:hypothetical protein
MSPKQVDKAASRLRTLLEEDENAPGDEEYNVGAARRKEIARLGVELAIGAARNLAVIAGPKS